MSGLLSGILTAVAIVATVMTGGALGIVAGALMAASYASSKGWIGGSVGKFFNSSTGHYLTMAVGLASAGAALYGNMTAVNAGSTSVASGTASTAGAESSVNAATAGNIASEGSAAGNAAAASANAAAPVGSSVAANAAMAGGDAAIAAPVVNGTMGTTMTGGLQYGDHLMDTVAQSGGGTLPSGLTPDAQQFAYKTATQNAINSGQAGVGAPVSGSVGDAETNLGITNIGKTQAEGVNQNMSAVNATTKGAGNADGLQPVDTSQAVATGKNTAAQGAINEGEIANAPTAQPGILSRGMDIAEKHPGMLTMAGNALSGMAKGAADQKMMQEQIAAQQWGNMQWMDKGQVGNMQNAAGAPISMPGGYLARAQAVRNMVNPQNTPISAPTPAMPVLSQGQTAPGAVAPAGVH